MENAAPATTRAQSPRTSAVRRRSPAARRGRAGSTRRSACFCAPRPAAPQCCLLATAAALVWANVDAASYERVWRTRSRARDRPRRRVARSALLAEQRPDDPVLLRRRSRGATGVRPRRAARAAKTARCRCSPVSAGCVVPVAIFLAVNAGHTSAHGWGVAMSTDTAFALGALALVGPGSPSRCAPSCSPSPSSTTSSRCS